MDDILNIGFVFFDSGWCLIGRDRFVVYFVLGGEFRCDELFVYFLIYKVVMYCG